jgi:hypothetical protein
MSGWQVWAAGLIAAALGALSTSHHVVGVSMAVLVVLVLVLFSRPRVSVVAPITLGSAGFIVLQFVPALRSGSQAGLVAAAVALLVFLLAVLATSPG